MMDASNDNANAITWMWAGITVVLGLLATHSVVTLAGPVMILLLLACTALAWRQALTWGALRPGGLQGR